MSIFSPRGDGRARLALVSCGAAALLACVGCAAQPQRTIDPMHAEKIGKTFWPDPVLGRFLKLCQDTNRNAPKESCASIDAGTSYTVDGVVGWPEPYFRVTTSDGRTGFIDTMQRYSVSEDPKVTEARIAKKKADDTAECNRRGAPRIGMTVAQATATCWGKPDHVNRTSVASGTHDQFVYGSRAYLYFDNGVLTSIQESGRLR